MLWEARPVAYYAWSGVEMQTNSTQIARAIAQLYALTGSFDSPRRQRAVCRAARPRRPPGSSFSRPASAPRRSACPSGRSDRPAGAS